MDRTKVIFDENEKKNGGIISLRKKKREKLFLSRGTEFEEYEITPVYVVPFEAEGFFAMTTYDPLFATAWSFRMPHERKLFLMACQYVFSSVV